MVGMVVSQLCVLVASLAAGLFPEFIVPSVDGLAPQTSPVLSCVALGQGAFLLLIWPLTASAHRLSTLVGMLAMSLLISLPGIILAAVISDGTGRDVVRTIIVLLLLWPLALAAARWMSRPTGRPVALLGLLTVVIGLPAAYYIVREFVAASPLGVVERIWQVGPLTAAWAAAATRTSHWLPRPMWAALLWPVVAAVALLIGIIGDRRTSAR